ncbi:unnamed protein product, partial [Musa banksii]
GSEARQGDERERGGKVTVDVRWGPQLDQATYKNRQRLYLSEQFNEETHSPFVKENKTIIHPGEVNRIRELPQYSKIVATHADSPYVVKIYCC